MDLRKILNSVYFFTGPLKFLRKLWKKSSREGTRAAWGGGGRGVGREQPEEDKAKHVGDSMLQLFRAAMDKQLQHQLRIVEELRSKMADTLTPIMKRS